jgi:guanylate kinase
MLNSLAKAARRPRPFLMVLSAPSGGGKTTVCSRLLRRLPWLKRCVTATTRPPRKGEKDGRDYFFLSREEFKARVRSRGFYEWAHVHGNLYGTPRREVEEALKRGQSLILVIDVQGGAQVKKKSGDAVLVFLLPPSFQALKKRLEGRGKDAPAVVRRRLEGAKKELRSAKHYDYLVLNDRLDHAVDHVEEIARAARWRGQGIAG